MTTNSRYKAGRPDSPMKIADRLRALIPQMREDAECHRSWQSPAAQADLVKVGNQPLVDYVGDVEWHDRWARFYNEVADTMTEAADALAAVAVLAALMARPEGPSQP